MLQTGVESENDIVTVARVNILVPVRRQFAGMDHFRAPPPGYSCERVIEHFLDPGSPDRFYVRLLIGSTLFGADKTKHVRRQRAIRIKAELIIHIRGADSFVAHVPVIDLLAGLQFPLVHSEAETEHGVTNLVPILQRYFVL